MELKNVNKSITLTAEIVIDNRTIAMLSGHIQNKQSPGQINIQVLVPELYNDNKEKAREMQNEFQIKLWELEDSFEEEGE